MVKAAFSNIVLCSLASNSPTFVNNSKAPSAVTYLPGIFSASDTQKIIEQFKTLPGTHDHRQGKAVKRTNYFDQGDSVTSPDSSYSWIFERIRPLFFPEQSAETFQKNIDFVLLHEFDENGFFDWHVDCNPNDGTGRTMNINVMLTDRSMYGGGELVVGSRRMAPNIGDLYMYPASHPHKVVDITSGRRHTLVVAVKQHPLPGDYWEQTEKYFESLCEDSRDSKLHMLFGQFLMALGRPDAEIDEKFANSYACTAQA